jgi:hypothetical protein
MELIGSPETSVSNHITLRNNSIKIFKMLSKTTYLKYVSLS